MSVCTWCNTGTKTENLQWQREEESDKREREKTKTSDIRITSAEEEGGRAIEASRSIFSTVIITILLKEAKKSLWITPGPSKMR